MSIAEYSNLSDNILMFYIKDEDTECLMTLLTVK